MDIATILGLLASFGLISTAMLFGGDLSIFLNAPAVLIVMGGTFGAILTNYPLSVVLHTGSVIRKTLVAAQLKPGEVAEQFMGFAYLARREGILALEPAIKNMHNPYLRKGMQLTVDGLEPDSIKAIL